MKRRSFLLGLTGALAAPAVVRASSLMKIARLREEIPWVDWTTFNTTAMRIQMTETWAFGHDMWRRIYFDEARQEVISEQVFPERPFVVMPSGKLYLPENSPPPGTVITLARAT